MTFRCPKCGRTTSQPVGIKEVWCARVSCRNRRSMPAMKPIREEAAVG